MTIRRFYDDIKSLRNASGVFDDKITHHRQQQYVFENVRDRWRAMMNSFIRDGVVLVTRDMQDTLEAAGVDPKRVLSSAAEEMNRTLVYIHEPLRSYSELRDYYCYEVTYPRVKRTAIVTAPVQLMLSHDGSVRDRSTARVQIIHFLKDPEGEEMYKFFFEQLTTNRAIRAILGTN